MEDFRKKIVNCMLHYRQILTREYKRSNPSGNDALQKKRDTAIARKRSKINSISNMDFPEIPPVYAKCDEIATAIHDHNG
jgi:hypothetical protein